jgi:hypothetical protein
MPLDAFFTALCPASAGFLAAIIDRRNNPHNRANAVILLQKL